MRRRRCGWTGPTTRPPAQPRASGATRARAWRRVRAKPGARRPGRRARPRPGRSRRLDLHLLVELGILDDDLFEQLEVDEARVWILRDVVQLLHALRAAEHEVFLVADVDAGRLRLRGGHEARHV